MVVLFPKFMWHSILMCIFFFFARESTISSVLANHLHYEILFEESYYKDIYNRTCGLLLY